MPRTPVAIALGSNVGDRGAHLAATIQRLSTLLHDLRVSTVVETDPEGVPDLQAPFLNAALTGTTLARLLQARAAYRRLTTRVLPRTQEPGDWPGDV